MVAAAPEDEPYQAEHARDDERGTPSPSLAYRKGTRTTAIAAPNEEPLSKSATAQPRSRRGNHSATAFVAPGQFAASPAPSRKRNAQKLRSPVAKEVAMAASEYQSTPIDKPVRVPTRSSQRPVTACPTV
jgi:hypothetical protein